MSVFFDGIQGFGGGGGLARLGEVVRGWFGRGFLGSRVFVSVSLKEFAQRAFVKELACFKSRCRRKCRQKTKLFHLPLPPQSFPQKRFPGITKAVVLGF